ncbi:MAG: hypothetical protein R3C28_11400 [Pirellulaceae bacterium]
MKPSGSLPQKVTPDAFDQNGPLKTGTQQMIYTNRRRISQLVTSLLTAWCTLIALSGLASGQTLIDDFSDGDDVGWFRTTIDGSEGISDAGEWDVDDGRYHISSNRPVPDGFTISSFWRRPNQSPLGNGTVRFQVTAETEAIGAGIILAKDVVFDGSEDYGEFYEFAIAHETTFST